MMMLELNSISGNISIDFPSFHLLFFINFTDTETALYQLNLLPTTQLPLTTSQTQRTDKKKFRLHKQNVHTNYMDTGSLSIENYIYVITIF